MLTWLCAEVKQIPPFGLRTICQRYSAAGLPGSSVSAAMLADELESFLEKANKA